MAVISCAHRHKNPDGTAGGIVARTARIGERVYIHPDARVGERARIGPDSHIGRWARIGDGAHIGARALIKSRGQVSPGAKLGDDVYVGQDCVAPATYHIRPRT